MTLKFDCDNYVSLAVMLVSLEYSFIVYSVFYQILDVRCIVATCREVQRIAKKKNLKRVDLLVGIGETKAVHRT